MQNAKDSFYEVLRGRLASLGPDRSVVVRGVTRPAVVVDENEAQSVAGLPDCFHLHWSEAALKTDGGLPTVAATCAISYSTAGNAWNGGLDRGRVLAAMDAVLQTAVSAEPQNAPKYDYTGLIHGAAPTLLATRIWWGDLTLGPVKGEADQLSRIATVQVMSYQERGEA